MLGLKNKKESMDKRKCLHFGNKGREILEDKLKVLTETHPKRLLKTF